MRTREAQTTLWAIEEALRLARARRAGGTLGRPALRPRGLAPPGARGPGGPRHGAAAPRAGCRAGPTACRAPPRRGFASRPRPSPRIASAGRPPADPGPAAFAVRLDKRLGAAAAASTATIPSPSSGMPSKGAFMTTPLPVVCLPPTCRPTGSAAQRAPTGCRGGPRRRLAGAARHGRQGQGRAADRGGRPRRPRALGLRPGMALADARAMRARPRGRRGRPRAPRPRLLDAHRRLVRPLHAARRARRPDGVVLDIAGVAHLFGGEAALLRAIESGSPPGLCGAAARSPPRPRPPGRWRASARRARSRPPGPTPRRSRELFERPAARGPAARRRDGRSALAQAGLRRIGDLVLRPRAPIAARFGPQPVRPARRLLGRSKSADLAALRRAGLRGRAALRERHRPREDVERTILPLARHLCGLLDAPRRGRPPASRPSCSASTAR